MVLPAGKAQGLDLADVGNVAVDPRAVQADEHAQGAGAPVGICRKEEDGKTGSGAMGLREQKEQ